MIELWCWANGELQPSKGDGRGNERSLGINVAALDFVALNDVLPVLYAWTRVVREERELTQLPTTFRRDSATLSSVVGFLVTHHDWVTDQPWVDEYADDVNRAYGSAMAASRLTRTAQRRILCPTELGDGKQCGRALHLDSDPAVSVICRSCGREWSQHWLMRVMEDDPEAEIYLSAHEIAAYAQCSVKTVERLGLRPDRVRRWGKLFEWHDAMVLLPKKARDSA